MNNENRCHDMGHHHSAEHHNVHQHNKMGEIHHQNLMYNFNEPHHACPPHMHEPIVKCPIEKTCCRDIHHQVKHIQPVHTRIINRHIYNHCCVPHFTCSEENICCHNW